MMTTTLKIKGMSCGHCQKAVAEALEALQGVTKVEVDLDAGQAVVTHEGGSIDAMKEAVDEAGYEVTAVA